MAEIEREEEKKAPLTYLPKNPYTCPVCGATFNKEELMTGGGRLNAGQLTDELRRLYIPTKKYGKVYPLIYPVLVCPKCYFSALKEDFDKIPQNNIEKAKQYTEVREKYIDLVFGDEYIDFHDPTRDLKKGAISHLLAISSYSFYTKKFAPTLKKAVSALRAAWLFGDLFNETKQEKYAKIQEAMYIKALEFYGQALTKLEKGEENLDMVKFIGPDVDKDFKYDGILYIYAVLKYKLSYLEQDPVKKLQILLESKRILSKFVGIGKKSMDKPSDVIEVARDKYKEISELIEKMQQELGISEEDLSSM